MRVQDVIKQDWKNTLWSKVRYGISKGRFHDRGLRITWYVYSSCPGVSSGSKLATRL